MSRSSWDDDKCLSVWENLETKVPYDWKLTTKNGKETVAAQRLADILGLEIGEIANCLGADIGAAIQLRGLVSASMKFGDERKAVELARWIVKDWGGISTGTEAISDWWQSLEPFDDTSVLNFIHVNQTKRISSWSKILAFVDFERFTIYDSRTAVALNSAMVLSGVKPCFYMPPCRPRSRNDMMRVIKGRSQELSSGYLEYQFALKRFVELGFVDNILDAERRIFAGADNTVRNMMSALA